MKAPFPAFGGKSAVADLVWSHLGSIRNYVAPNYNGRREMRMVYDEPFCNSAAIMLANPHYDWENGRWTVPFPPIETINDLDPFISNFWRSIKRDPDAVAHHADWPVNEVDLHARHLWLVRQGEKWFRDRMLSDPDFYDVKIAGWWVWGISAWIGPAWCSLDDPVGNGRTKDGGVIKKRPNIGHRGRGIHKSSLSRPHLTSRGLGIHKRQIPILNGRGMGVHASSRRDNLKIWFQALSDRLRDVRVTCGDWSRVTGKSVTWNNNCTRGKKVITAVVLDPPYAKEAQRTTGIYAEDDLEVAHKVREWALSEGDNPKMRIVLFGYEREHGPHMPDTWTCVSWKTNGGYSNQNSQKNSNPSQERIWFSPHCVIPTSPLLTLIEGL